MTLSSFPVEAVQVMLALPRLGMALFLLPFMGGQMFPPLARVAISIPFAYFASQLWAPLNPGEVEASLLWLVAKEAVLGLLLGIVWALPFYALEITGHLVDFQSGLTFTQITDPFNGNSVGISASFLMKFFSMLFIAAGGLLLFLDTLFLSYRAWPITEILPHGFTFSVFRTLLFETHAIFTLALLFAAPVVLILLLVELAVAVIGHSFPRFPVSDVVLPIKNALVWWILLAVIGFVAERSLILLPHLADITRQILR
ncbi:type III secretion protein T [Noviherbaspirillum humi]|uniref:Type III secretion protein T n=1 Tax=Noviherbaspirillum humi TaxID=1688639 RepID=A0A239JY60_9BURK|nr:flagellar biosynthetic protein FliR [Noviherbaspirillum humi]SNT10589.1 type III secretion protein T [Noviherbaspirillum humi]